MARLPLIPAKAGIQRLGPRFRRDEPDNALTLAGVTLIADTSGALFWPEEKMLIVADLHLEKGSAFAARGVLLPPYDTASTLARLARLIERYAPQIVMALGDSFHDGGGPARMADTDRASLKALAARARLAMDRGQSRSRSGGWRWRPLRRHAGASAPSPFAMSLRQVRARAKLPVICIRSRAWRGADAR